SHPSRVRGLKHPLPRVAQFPASVAPLAGAWIETGAELQSIWLHRKSHPSRVRGLKQDRNNQELRLMPVAPLAGAWIETPKRKWPNSTQRVAPLAGAWIETRSK